MEPTKGEWYWTVDEKGRPLHLRSAFEDGSGSKHILFTSNDFQGEYAFENAEANAERIVKAVNCHDDLVEACERALEFTIFKGYDKLTIQLKQVLAKAKSNL